MSRTGYTRDWWQEPPDSPPEDVLLVPMTLDHLDDILEIEEASFPAPWSREAFEYDITRNPLAHYWSLVKGDEIIGYAGIWLIDRIAHLTTMCVREGYRGTGLGKWLLLEVMKLGGEMGAERFTLEVRRSNVRAIKLYESAGYRIVGVREKYYTEIGEDALVMWTGSPPFEG
jgi:ribosomal-protein-alanine N-acetyltransferase